LTATLSGSKKALLTAVGGHLTPFGFSAKPKGQTFHRFFQGGRSAFHLAFIDHANDFDVSADLAIRFDRVEELVNRHTKLLSSKEKLDTSTLGVELGTLHEGKPRRWTVSLDTDVSAVAREIAEFFEAVGIGYLEQFEDPGRAFVALSSNKPAGWTNSPIHGARCMRAVALGSILERDAETIEVAKRCEAFLVGRKDPGLSAFRNFFATLGIR
jgi:hypothetical protein